MATGAALDGLKGALGVGLGMAAENVGKEGLKGLAKDAGKHAVQGAAMGAAGGFAVGAVRGEDAWNSAGRGAISGAVLGGARGGVRSVTGAQAGQSSLASAMEFGEQSGISKQVTALGSLSKNAIQSSRVARRR